ncbi:MAG TPA: hypothetical protein VK625_08135 [Flavitalea sp.]|nr:hypothetical protein [Flavitalea sp.]
MHIEIIEKEFTDSFIAIMKEVQEVSPGLPFRNMDNIRFLLKDHIGRFTTNKKNQKYREAGMNKKVFYN